MGVPKDWLTKVAHQAERQVRLGQVPVGRTPAELHWRRSGLVFGLPIASEALQAALKKTAVPGRTLWFVVNLVAYAERTGHKHSAEDVLDALRRAYAPKYSDMPEAKWSEKAGAAMRKRVYLAGSPLVGLTVAHAFLGLDAAEIKSVLDGEPLLSIERYQAEQEVILATLARLAELREDLPPHAVQTIYAWQLGELAKNRKTKSHWLKTVQSPPHFEESVARSQDPLRLFRLTAMAAALDGRVTNAEQEALARVGHLCGLKGAKRRRETARALAFYHRHRKALDPLVAAEAATSVSQRVGPLAWRALVKFITRNGRATVTEIRETGDLALLLAKRGRGLKLSEDETARMRSQLVDVAKVVPGLAVLTLPGGLVLLPLLAKLLPFDLLPSAFNEPEESFRVFKSPAESPIGADLSREPRTAPKPEEAAPEEQHPVKESP